MIRFFALATFALVASPVVASAAQAAPVSLLPLTVTTAHGPRHFRVEVARTPAEQERGLMFRKTLPPKGGMLFPLGPPREATFWMKNTVLSLDLIFIRADGTIARIAEHAVPYSTDIIDSGEPVTAVLEIAGGGAAKAGITAGDRVRWHGR